jgi:hypothetical protein
MGKNNESHGAGQPQPPDDRQAQFGRYLTGQVGGLNDEGGEGESGTAPPSDWGELRVSDVGPRSPSLN